MPRTATKKTTELDTLLDEAGAPSAPKPEEPDMPAPPSETPNPEEGDTQNGVVLGKITTDRIEVDTLSPEKARIAALQAELAAEEARVVTNPTTASGRPVPESALTPEQLEIRRLEDRLASKRAENISKSPDVFEDAEEGITIHFLADGLSAQGRVWYTGQTVTFGSGAYEQTKDRHGNSWLDLDEAGQWKKYGKVMFRRGAWGGAVYEDAIAAEDAKRGTAAPVVII